MWDALPVTGCSLPPQQPSVRLTKRRANETVRDVTCRVAPGVASRVWDACCDAEIIKVGDFEDPAHKERGKPEAKAVPMIGAVGARLVLERQLGWHHSS